MISICSESLIFTDSVFDSVHKLIKNKIWPINPLIYKAWKNNFKTQEESYLCACLLDSLIFRTNEQILSCFHSIFRQHIPSVVFKNPNNFTYNGDVLAMLQKKQNLVKLITVSSNDASGKSSHLLANLLRKNYGIKQQNIIAPSQIEDLYDSGTSFFIFIDDFLGTGTQFKNQLDISINGNWDKGVILYCPIIGHEKGINDVINEYPNVTILPVELIKEEYCFFKKYFSNNGNTPVLGKKFYEDFLITRGFRENHYGFGELGVSVAFEYSCPDNSLLAFWGVDEANQYNRLFN